VKHKKWDRKFLIRFLLNLSNICIFIIVCKIIFEFEIIVGKMLFQIHNKTTFLKQNPKCSNDMCVM
jgi:hypothetical protein